MWFPAVSASRLKRWPFSLGYTEKAVISARAARKKRWICFFIILVVLIIVGIVVGIEVSRSIRPKQQ